MRNLFKSKKRKKKKNQSGFTLIELLIYVSIVTISLTVMMNFVVDVTVSAAKAKIAKETQQNARLLISRLTQEIRTAKQISDVQNDSITLINSDDQNITFDCCDSEDRVLYITDSEATPLTNNRVRVTDLTFEQIANSISISLTVEQKSLNPRAGNQDQVVLSSTIVPRQSLY